MGAVGIGGSVVNGSEKNLSVSRWCTCVRYSRIEVLHNNMSEYGYRYAGSYSMYQASLNAILVLGHLICQKIECSQNEK